MVVDKKVLLYALFLVTLSPIYSQNIVKLEYSIDQFVSEGTGNIVDIPNPSEEIEFDLDVDIMDLTPGLHTLFVRSLNSDGKWSIPVQRNFMVQPEVQNNRPQITTIEYALDGFVQDGNGTKIDLPAGRVMLDSTLEMDITGLEDGLHTIMMRAQNDDGVWSLPVQRNFDVQNVGPGKITAVNYRFFNDAFDGEWESGLITPPTSDVDSVFDLSIENIPLENTYSVELYAQNESGIRGFSVFLNDLDLRVNSSPAKSKDELNLMVNVDQVIQISMDSLFDDPDVAFGDSLSYTLENISNAGLGTFSQLTEGSVFSFSPDRNHIGAYTFAIRATDLAGESDELPVTLDVNWTDNTGNRPPQRLQNQLQLVMFTDQVIEVSLDTLITDPDVPFGDILTYDIVDENNSGVLAFTSTNDNLVYSFSPTSSQVGAYDFTFIATDLNGESENLSVTLEVNDNSQRENRPPFRLIESLNLTMPVGGMIQLSLDTLISDLDIPFGDRLSYSLMDQNNSGVLAFTQTTDNRIYSFSPDSNQSGLYRFNFRATDLFGASEDLPTTLNVNELVTGLDVIDVAQSNIRFFPNPVKDHLNISIEEQNVLPYTLKIYDLHGKIVLQINEVTTKRFKVELNEMPQGIYHLVLVGPGSSIRKRFLYEK